MNKCHVCGEPPFSTCPKHDTSVTPSEPSLKSKIQDLLNRECAESGSNTPDFILASYLSDCLSTFDRAVRHRDRWYGNPHGSDSEESYLINEIDESSDPITGAGDR